MTIRESYLNDFKNLDINRYELGKHDDVARSIEMITKMQEGLKSGDLKYLMNSSRWKEFPE